jgi:hypothetical protein
LRFRVRETRSEKEAKYKLIFRLSEPFRSKVGKKIQINTNRPLPLRILLEKLPDGLFEISSHRGRITDDRILAHILFFREGCLIRPDDPVNVDDTIDVMLQVTGG